AKSGMMKKPAGKKAYGQFAQIVAGRTPPIAEPGNIDRRKRGVAQVKFHHLRGHKTTGGGLFVREVDDRVAVVAAGYAENGFAAAIMLVGREVEGVLVDAITGERARGLLDVAFRVVA